MHIVPIYTCFWFEKDAKLAAEFYCTVFQQSQITSSSSQVVTWQMHGQKFMALNGAVQQPFNPSVSFFVHAESEDQIHSYWQQLQQEGKILMPLNKYPWSGLYGWVQDRFGINWQLSFESIVPLPVKFSPVFMFTGNNAGKCASAIQQYTQIFDSAQILLQETYQPNEGDIVGNIKHARFLLQNQLFMAMDSSYNHGFNFNHSISLVVECTSQQEIDQYWQQLGNGGKPLMCGWIEDAYGLPWQIIPSNLGKLMSNPATSSKVMQSLLQMQKIDIATLQKSSEEE